MFLTVGHKYKNVDTYGVDWKGTAKSTPKKNIQQNKIEQVSYSNGKYIFLYIIYFFITFFRYIRY